MRTIQVYFNDGDHLTTSINGTDSEIARHYLGHRFEAGSDTKHHVALLVKFLDTGAARGLRIRNIENGHVARIHGVRLHKQMIDETRSSSELMLITPGGSEYSINDCWVFHENGKCIDGVGYQGELV